MEKTNQNQPKKRIILINEIGLNEVFTRAFQSEGYEVFPIPESPFVYKKTPWARLKNIFYRTVLKDQKFFGKDYYRKLNKEVTKKLRSIGSPVDYAMVFRADYYSKQNITLLKKLARKMVTYQYDGWELGSGILRYRNDFDRVFFFEKSDMPKFGDKALPLTNCYFPTEGAAKDTPSEYDFFYLGTGTQDRIGLIKNFAAKIGKNFRINAILTIPEYQKEISEDGISLRHKGLKYRENIEAVQKSKCLIDIKFTYHNGLSFRFFEALYYKKKLITNNLAVRDYDFYHPNNILITDFINLDSIADFMAKPYHEIDQNIVDKYGFQNWSRYVLDLPPYQEITHP